MDKAKHILVVDDEEVNRRIACLFLQKAGYRVEEAIDAHDAWARLGRLSFDLILLDISMPGMSGIELCRLIRSELPHGGPPIAAYTAHALTITPDELALAGFDGLIAKPISKSILLSTVADLIAIRT